MSTTTIQAPDEELARRHDEHDHARGQGAEAVDGQATPPALLAPAPPAHDHARLGQGEGEEDAERVERDEGADAGVEDRPAAGPPAGQGHDAGGERQPLAAEGELARHEAVARQERGEAREVGEAGVGGQDQYQHGRDLDENEERAVADQESRRSATAPSALARVRHDAECAGQEADAEEQRGEDRCRPDQGDARIAPLRRLEGWHAVADGLDAGQRRRPGAERTQDRRDASACRRPLRDRVSHSAAAYSRAACR